MTQALLSAEPLPHHAVMPLTPDNVATIRDVSLVASIFSCIGSVFIIACYVAYPHLRKMAFTL